ncbi:MAG TPA: glycosyltransferase family 4 protein [Anaerolineae bacterium]|nr:glycosyltransferase family 4 protein [Anaerolineae bacterium]
MRVAMLGQYPLKEERIVGGIEAIVVPLLRGLARFDDLELHVVTCQPGVEDKLSRTKSGWPLHTLKRRRLGRLTFHLRDVAGLQRVLKELSPDVVHAQGVGIYAAAAANSLYPYVVTVHGIIFREADFATRLGARARSVMDSIYERYRLARVENLIAISPYVEEELEGRGDFKRVYRIENPVDDRFFSVTHAEGERATILYAGRVIRRKGLLELLRALTKVREAVPQVRLRVAGESESDLAYLDTCQQFLADHELERVVTFLGSLTVEQMVKEYARCTVFALPSKQETAPVVVAEAMAAGRPVVATRACGMPYMVAHEESGLLAEYGDTVGWGRALTGLLSDPALACRMGRKGRDLAQARFSPDAVARATRDVYRELVGDRR